MKVEQKVEDGKKAAAAVAASKPATPASESKDDSLEKQEKKL